MAVLRLSRSHRRYCTSVTIALLFAGAREKIVKPWRANEIVMRHLNGQTAARYGSRDDPRAMIVELSDAHEAPLAFTAMRR
jgi:hypothetical protein